MPGRGSRPTLVGLLLMLLAAGSFVVMAAFVKALRERGMSTFETMAWRMGPGLLWLWVELRLRGHPIWRPRRPKLVMLRSCFGGLAMSGSFFAVASLTLLQHTVLHLAQPVFVAILAPLILRERLRGAALLALLLAIGGALSVLRIDRVIAEGMLAEVPLIPGLVGLAAAGFSALAHLTIRMTTGRLGAASLKQPWVRKLTTDTDPEAPETVVFHFALHLTLISLALGLLAGDFRGLPAGLGIGPATGMIVGMAGFGALGQLCMSRAYARSQAPAVAIVGYAGIPLSVAFDTIFWGATVTASSLLGALLMATAGVLLVQAQRRS